MTNKTEKEEIEILDFEEIYKNESGGIFMPIDIICDKRLDWFEKTLLSIYRCYGEGITCNEVLHMLGGKPSRSTYQRAKRRLRELGMIGNCYTTETSGL